ncbi:serine/threonine protein phosphatase [Aeromonas caviae]|uniref:metallophosphoesterase n=1 Tax=Aeromonas caviae TaxID=648 RepID=UPI001CC4FCC5|nr:metallophosphoesterase [Aeromonas caviae]BDA17624.1 serine/threonine protein phosphatase [Aeromonas caviae]
MSSLVKRFSANTAGRDFAVGDIHGHFTLLQRALDKVEFDPVRDRLFSVGDLVDRGPECELVLEWLAKPWFHPVRGNHDDYVCRHDTCDLGNWVQNGGGWFLALPHTERQEYAVQFRELPIAIEVETPGGLIGLVHADCPFPSWRFLLEKLEDGAEGNPGLLRSIKNSCMWSRQRVEQGDDSGVPDVHALVVGHTPMSNPSALGNVIHIDTAGWCPQKGGFFTLLDLHSLQAHMIRGARDEQDQG